MNCILRRGLFLTFIFTCFFATAFAQTTNSSPTAAVAPAVTTNGTSTNTSDIDDIRRQLREQREEIERLRVTLAEQSRVINEMRGQPSSQAVVTDAPQAPAQSVAIAPQTTESEGRLRNVENETRRLARQLGPISFSGELRVQYDSIFGQLNSSPNSSNPTVLGNELSPRHRGRFRARLGIRGQMGQEVFLGSYTQAGERALGREFDWGLRFSSGSLSNVISSNQVLTDFYSRKSFALDQAFVGWRPRSVPGLRLQGGKFDIPWTRTEMTIDSDIQVEGVSETFSRSFRNSTVRNFSLVAWQLPFLERNAAFVRNANGSVNLDESRRQGRDLALYGAQAQTRLGLTPNLALTLSVADLYFSGTQFITPIRFFGNQLELPVTITVPATATTPAQTVSGVATISRELLVAGNGNLGISVATNNATNRDGRLASGFNLIDMIGRLDFTRHRRYPVTALFNFVTNTQARDVIAAGPNGSNVILENNENNGYWAEIQMRRLQPRGANESFDTPMRGDLLFGYTFIRIEKDAVLTPFNWDDLAQPSDTRAQRLSFTYTADPRVTLNFTGLFNQRPNGLLGAFGQTPPGSLNRPTIRLQFDVIYRFN